MPRKVSTSLTYEAYRAISWFMKSDVRSVFLCNFYVKPHSIWLVLLLLLTSYLFGYCWCSVKKFGFVIIFFFFFLIYCTMMILLLYYSCWFKFTRHECFKVAFIFLKTSTSMSYFSLIKKKPEKPLLRLHSLVFYLVFLFKFSFYSYF